jgi:hypothetical protein
MVDVAPPRTPEEYRQTLLRPGARLQRVAYGLLAVANLAIVATAVILILRG